MQLGRHVDVLIFVSSSEAPAVEKHYDCFLLSSGDDVGHRSRRGKRHGAVHIKVYALTAFERWTRVNQTQRSSGNIGVFMSHCHAVKEARRAWVVEVCEGEQVRQVRATHPLE